VTSNRVFATVCQVLAAFLRSPQTRARDPSPSAGRLFVDKAVVCDAAGRVAFNATTEVLSKAEDFISTTNGKEISSESIAVVPTTAYRDDRLHDDLFVTYVSDLEATDSDESDSGSEADLDSDADTAKTEEKHADNVELEQSKSIFRPGPGKAKRTTPLVEAEAVLRDRSREDLDCMDPGVWRCCFDGVSIAALDASEEDAERETATWGEGHLASEESCRAWAARKLR
jgi:hypothetical protein